MKSLSIVLVALASVLFGCIGFSFGPGHSSTDTLYFAEPPTIVKKGEQYMLRWRYGSMGFYFLPRYEVKDGALWFSLQATSSSGNLSGREFEMLIVGSREIAALKKGRAFWWASDGSRVPLEIIEEPNNTPEPTPISYAPR